MKYGIEMLMKQVNEDERAIKIFDQFIPGMRTQIGNQPMAANMSIQKLAAYTRGAVSEETLQQLDAALKELSDGTLTKSEQEKVERYQKIAEEDKKSKKIVASQPKQTAVYPGKPWLDTNGARIHTHGGALYYENDTFYWYGENKEKTDGKCSIWTWGIRAYSSKDLYNWEDLGLIIEPNLINPDDNLFPDMHVDRPHIIKCEATEKYVCWIKLSGEEACFLILQSDSFLGPYEVVEENYYPFGMKVGDFDVITEDGKAYLFMANEGAGIVGIELSKDYLSAEKELSRQYQELYAPFCREGVALFTRNGKKYILTSGMTGYIPNQSDAAVASSWEECFTSIGNPHVDDKSISSFNSQISQVFKIPGKKDLYVSIADRWVPEFVVDARRADVIRRGIANHHDSEKYPVTPEEQIELVNSPMLETANTSIADYVWLPLRFEGDKVYIDWKDEWKLEDYE